MVTTDPPVNNICTIVMQATIMENTITTIAGEGSELLSQRK